MGNLDQSHERKTSKGLLLVWRLAVGSHPPGGGKEIGGFLNQVAPGGGECPARRW